MERLLNCPRSNWLTYQSVKEVITGQEISPDIFFCNVKGTFESQLQVCFKARNQDPILIFLEKKDESLVTQIKKIAEIQKLSVTQFNDEEELLNNTNHVAKVANGVFIVDKAFGRGIDFKFKKEASVLILLNDDITISWEDAVQMAGRGNRSQGNPTALLLLAKATKKTAEIITILKTNSASCTIDGC